MNIVQLNTTNSYTISEIDSIIFKSNECDEIQIGNQVWMCKNLDVDHYRNGDSIPEVTDRDEWASPKGGAWCYYNNDPENGKIYGKLYNWLAVNDPRGLAPEGWHVASDEEWTTLETYLHNNNKYWCGKDSLYIGKSMASTEIWNSSDFDCDIGYNLYENNSSGFSALPGGNRGYASGDFYYIGDSGYWWTSTEFLISYAWYRTMGYNFPSFYSLNYYMTFGFSVRCVRD